MKKILITGANSYIGTSFEKYITENFSSDYIVDTIDMRDSSWEKYDFSKYDSVFHVAGIAHQKETKYNAYMYYEINSDLPYSVAKKSKESGVKQFIFLSSMSVYGKENGIITRETIPHPKTNYGKSKLEGEEKIKSLEDLKFKVCILRPPMVYGDGCKGNYQTIVKLIDKFPFFPRVNNQRSMIHINTLVLYIKMLLDNEKSGLFFPQEKKYISTMDLAKEIADKKNKKVYFSWLLGIVIVIFRPFFKILRKAFGDLIYNIDD